MSHTFNVGDRCRITLNTPLLASRSYLDATFAGLYCTVKNTSTDSRGRIVVDVDGKGSGWMAHPLDLTLIIPAKTVITTPPPLTWTIPVQENKQEEPKFAGSDKYGYDELWD